MKFYYNKYYNIIYKFTLLQQYKRQQFIMSESRPHLNGKNLLCSVHNIIFPLKMFKYLRLVVSTNIYHDIIGIT